jgi:hypothetical protein
MRALSRAIPRPPLTIGARAPSRNLQPVDARRRREQRSILHVTTHPLPRGGPRQAVERAKALADDLARIAAGDGPDRRRLGK